MVEAELQERQRRYLTVGIWFKKNKKYWQYDRGGWLL